MEATVRRTRTLLLSPTSDRYDRRCERPHGSPFVAHMEDHWLPLRAATDRKQKPRLAGAEPVSWLALRETQQWAHDRLLARFSP
jgi:hypothetical protein